MTGTPTRAIYFRLPETDAQKLDSVAADLALTPQKLIKSIVLERLGQPNPMSSISLASLESSRTSPEVMTAQEAAEFLRVDTQVLSIWVDADRLPSRGMGDTWRCSRDGLISWLGTQPR